MDLKTILNQSGDPIIVIDGHGQVLWNNTSAEHFLGLNPEGPGSITLTDFLYPQSIPVILSTKQFKMLEIDLNTPNSGTITQTAIVIDISSGAPDNESFLVVFKSFLLDQNRYYEHYKEELSAIAHDLKNPLGVIFGYADTLLTTPVGEGLKPQQKHLLGRIRHTISRSIDLIKNYQHLFQIQTGRIRPAETPYDLNLAVQNVLNSHSVDQPPKQAVKTHLGSEKMLVPLSLIQLEQTISNIFSNAQKYAPPDGTISLETWLSGERAFLKIHNNGSYIPPHELSTIFDKYSRASTGTKVSGSGLGLFIVKAILNAIGGTVSVESDEELGTTFTLGYPCLPYLAE